MKPANQVTACVIDHGLFLPLAIKLGEQFDRVLYWTPWERGFPTLNDCIIGDGYSGVERIDDFWEIKDQIDLFIFPDIQRSGLQLELESQGKAVWGSRQADEIEMNRQKFLHTLLELGLEVPKYKVIRGVTALKLYLKDKPDRYIKISKYRGSMETWHWKGMRESEGELDQLAVRFGPAKEFLKFLVFEPIDADIEVGYDGYCIDGRFPSIGVQGYESKDRGFLCRIQDYDSLPKQVTEINDAFSKVLAAYRYRNFWSSEIRINDDQEIFIDPCCRCPSPSTECQIELYGNLGEIIWHGAQGELVDPEPTADFAVSAVMTVKDDRSDWIVAEFPPEIMPWVKCGNSCLIDGRICFPPGQDKGCEIGWLAATGGTASEAIENLKEYAKEVPEGIEVHLDAIVDLIHEIETAQEEGIKFSKQLPKPSEVIK